MQNGIKLLGIKVTNECNLHCYMCGQRKLRNQEKQQIDFEKICNVIDELRGRSKYEVFLWGGEPFLYKEIIPLIQYIKSQKLQLTINTNGTYLEEYAQSLVDCNVNRVIVSIDGSRELHDEIRGVQGTYQKVMKGVHKINELKNVRPFVTANIVVTSRNYKYITEIVNELYQQGIHYIELQLPIYISNKMGERYQYILEKEFGIKAEKWKGYQGDYFDVDVDCLLRQLRRLPAYTRIVPALSESLIIQYFQGRNECVLEKGCCKVPFEQVRIEANGDVVICPDFPDVVIGNILIQDIDEILNSELLGTFKRYIRRYGKIPICDKCVMYYEA